MPNTRFHETLKCLKQTSANTYELTEPHLLYLSGDQSQAYLKAMDDDAYSGTFHNATVKIIKDNLMRFFPESWKELSLIDLGPGYPDKSIPIADYFQSKGKILHYYPVDVSQTYLDLAVRQMQKRIQHVYPVHGRFEDLEKLLPSGIYSRPVFVMLGLTFMNFEPNGMMSWLKSVARDGGWICVATELVTEANPVSRILSAYQNDSVRKFVAGPLLNLGFGESDLEFNPVFNNNCVELRFQIRAPVMSGHVPLKTGDVVVTAISYRYTRESWQQLLKIHFDDFDLYDSQDGNTVVACCLRSNGMMQHHKL